MKYVVVWPAAKFLVDGKRVVITKGNEVPSGVDEDVLHQLVLTGAIVASAPPAVSAAAAALVDPVDPGEITRPTSRSNRGEWEAWGLRLGLTAQDYSALDKPGVVALVTEYQEAADKVAETEGEDTANDGSSDPSTGDNDPQD